MMVTFLYLKRLSLGFRFLCEIFIILQLHKVMLITKTERLEFYANLGDITSANKKLFSCHRSFLVNLDNIARIDKTQLMIYFENGDSCPVSRLKMKALLKKWSEVKDY